MANKSFFYSTQDEVTKIVKEERLLSIYKGVDFVDKYLHINKRKSGQY